MGMYDSINCEYPLPTKGNFDGLDYQTKDLDCSLTRYTITAGGRLVEVRFLEQCYSLSSSTPPDIQIQALEVAAKERGVDIAHNEHGGLAWSRDLNHHGDINFYSSYGDPVKMSNGTGIEGWVEFRARFTLGQLSWILLEAERTPEESKERAEASWKPIQRVARSEGESSNAD